MSEKRRKRASHDESDWPSKKAATEQLPADVVEVSFLPDDDDGAPAVGMSPMHATWAHLHVLDLFSIQVLAN